MGGGDSGGDGGAAAFAKAEEDRKASLRARINQVYGIDDPAVTGAGQPTIDQFTTKGTQAATDSDGGLTAGTPDVVDQAGFDKALAAYNANPGVDTTAKAARDAEAKTEADLTTANQNFYGDQLQHATDIAYRNNRFALADRGLLGGSAQLDTERELGRDNTLGATRIADQVATALATLKNANEGERLNATQLVNQGSGADAVASAQAGITRALQNTQAQTKANITGDLFAGGANSVAAANSGFNPALLAQYQNRLSSFFNPSAGAARATPT